MFTELCSHDGAIGMVSSLFEAFWAQDGIAIPDLVRVVCHTLSMGKSRSGGKRKPEWVRVAVLELHAASRGSHRQLAAEFNRLHASSGMTVCGNTVRTWLRKYASEMEAVRSATRNRIPRRVPRNHCWGIDATGKADPSGRVHFIFGIIDHGTRLAIELVRMEEETAPALLRKTLLAVQRYGKQRSIRTDNAPVFRSAICRDGLAAAGIRHVLSARGKPWQNGRIERLFLTLKQKLDRLKAREGWELDGLLREFRFRYNQVRPHQHLHGHTPAEACFGINPYRCAPKAVSRFVGWNGLLTGLYLHR